MFEIPDVEIHHFSKPWFELQDVIFVKKTFCLNTIKLSAIVYYLETKKLTMFDFICGYFIIKIK